MMKTLKNKFVATFIAGALLLFGITVLVNMIFNNIKLGRFDLTADQIYKLSPAVEKILTELEAPIDITYYVSSSEKMPTQWKNLERDVIDKLQELKLVSGGMLDFTVFDPSAEEEREAQEASRESEDADGIITRQQPTRKMIAQRLAEKGVIPFGVQTASEDEFAIKRIYSSLVLSYLDRREEVIEEVRPETFGSLEYEIMSLIYKLIANKRPVIGFYPGKPVIPPEMRQYYQQGPPPDMYEYAVQILEQGGYEVIRTNITKNDAVPEDLQTMILMIDQPLNERQLFEIDKLVNQGVHIIMAGQQNNYQIMSSQEPGQFELRGMPSGLNINELTKSYGFEFDPFMFMDAHSAYIQVPVYQTQRVGMFNVRQQRMEPVTKPVIIRIAPENINTQLSISNKITDIFYLFGGRLILHDDVINEKNLDVQTLFASSSQSWVRQGYGYGPVNTAPPMPEQLLRNQPLGVLIEGEFESRYTGQPRPAWPDEEAEVGVDAPDEAGGLKDSPVHNRMLVYGGTKIFQNDVLPSVHSHMALLLNSADALTLGEELINIRSKNIRARKIKQVGSAGKALSKAFVIWFTPVLFVVLGVYLNIKRKRKDVLTELK